jgi:hypothetical protein
VAGDREQGPPGRHPRRLSAAERDRLDALHALGPLSRRVQLVHAFLFAAASDAEFDSAAQAHEEQARQLRDPTIRAALRAAWEVVDPLRFTPGHGHPDEALADLLALAPPELAGAVRAELAAAGLDSDAPGWPL